MFPGDTGATSPRTTFWEPVLPMIVSLCCDTALEKGLATFSVKGKDSKYFQWNGPDNLCHRYSQLLNSASVVQEAAKGNM